MSEIKESFIRLLLLDQDFRRQVRVALGIDFNLEATLSAIAKNIEELSEAQKNTQKTVDELVEAQKNTQKTVDELVEAQKRNEERLSKMEVELAETRKEMEKSIAELSEAQKNTQKTVDELVEAQKNTQKTVDELVEAQKRNEERLSKMEVELAETRKEMEKSIAELANAVKELRDAVYKLDRRVNSMGERWGEDNEEMIREFFKEILEQEGIDISKVYKYSFTDKEGNYGTKGKIYEVDIFASNSKTYLMEVKSHADDNDVIWFHDRCEVISKHLGLKNTVKMLLVDTIYRTSLELASQYGIKVVAGDVTERHIPHPYRSK